MAASAPTQRSRRLSLAVLVVAGLASMATSPAMRSSSATYEEEITLTKEAPAAARHLTVEVTNRDPKLSSVDLVASTWSKGKDNVLFKNPDVLLSLQADPSPDVPVSTAFDYMEPALSFFEACKSSCVRGATVVVRLADPGALADSASVTTNLEVSLAAMASEQGSGPIDGDLVLRNDADRAFQGAPVTLIAPHSGTLHVGSDVGAFSADFKITIDGDVLREPFGFPLVGEIIVGATDQTSLGHPNAHHTAFAFTSEALPEDSFAYGFAGITYDEPPFNTTTILDLFPLCEPAKTCEIDAQLTSQYYESMNDPVEGEPPPRSIDLDWYLEIRLEAYDGRELPEGAITIEPAD